jgi:hypothetical protein
MEPLMAAPVITINPEAWLQMFAHPQFRDGWAQAQAGKRLDYRRADRDLLYVLGRLMALECHPHQFALPHLDARGVPSWTEILPIVRNCSAFIAIMATEALLSATPKNADYDKFSEQRDEAIAALGYTKGNR